MARLKFLILFLPSIFGGISLVAVKDLFCKDPDTGKLYRVNSTWTSTTFCGSYTCRVRKRKESDHPKSLQVLGIQNASQVNPDRENVENKETASDKQNHNLNLTMKSKVTSDNIDLKHNSKPLLIQQSKVTSVNGNGKYNSEPVLQRKLTSNNVNIKHSSDAALRKKVAADNFNLNFNPHAVANSKVDTTCNKVNVATVRRNSDSDRYLTEEEIGAIATLLKTLKKGELDSILQVYRIAQDLYSEIDKIASMQSKEELKENEDDTTKGPSYWYEPLTITNFKVKPEHVRKPNKQKERPVKFPVTDSAPSKPVDTDTVLANFIPKLNKPHHRLILSDSLSSDDLKNIIFYHPMTDFQRQASYLRPSTTPAHPQIYNYPAQKRLLEKPVVPLSNIPFQSRSQKLTPEKQFQLNDKIMMSDNFMSKGDKADPFLQSLKEYASILQNNGPRGIRTLSLPLSLIKQLSENGNNFVPFLSITRNHNQPSGPTGAILAQIPDDVFLTPDLDLPLPVKDSVEDTIMEEIPDWMTGPVGVRLFTDVKSPEEAIKSMNLLPLPFKKSKMIKPRSRVSVIDGNRRRKRDNKVEEDGDFEAYLEKFTCQSEMEPGFFTMGDPTQPYPACCPQKVKKDSR